MAIYRYSIIVRFSRVVSSHRWWLIFQLIETKCFKFSSSVAPATFQATHSLRLPSWTAPILDTEITAESSTEQCFSLRWLPNLSQYHHGDYDVKSSLNIKFLGYGQTSPLWWIPCRGSSMLSNQPNLLLKPIKMALDLDIIKVSSEALPNWNSKCFRIPKVWSGCLK